MTNTNIQRVFLLGTIALVFAVSPLFARAQSTYHYGIGSPGPSDGGYSPSSYPYNPYYGSSGYYGYPIAQALSVACAPMQRTAATGENMTWFASVTGGTGQYQYFWSGTDGLSGYSSTLAKSYTNSGEKFATLTVVSGSQQITIGCNQPVSIGARVAQTQNTGISSGTSCYAAQEKIAPGESVTWLSVSSGTMGTTTYSWGGTDDLSGSGPLASKTYGTSGLKHAFLPVPADGRRNTVVCTNAVTVAPRVVAAVRPTPVAPRVPPVTIVCSANKSEAEVGETVEWSVTAIGGTGAYSFIWNGDEELSGTATTARKTYADVGEKSATVAVTSGGNTTARECSEGVQIVPSRASGLMAALGFLDGCGLLALLAFILSLIALYLAFGKRKEEASRHGMPETSAPLYTLPRREELEGREDNQH